MYQKHYWRRGDVFFAELAAESTHVHCGNRPWLILQNNTGNRTSPTTIVAPLTTSMRHAYLDTHVIVKAPWLPMTSVVCLEQIRTVDKSDDWDYIGHFDADTMRRVDAAILVSLGVKTDG